MSRGYMGQVTDRDVELVNLMIGDPTLSLEELGTRLGITKQAVAERKRRLEDDGFTKSFYFWNITPRFEGTKRVLMNIDGDVKRIQRIVKLIDVYNPVIVFFRTTPEYFFEGKTASLIETVDEVEGILHFNNEDEEERLRSELERLGVENLFIEPILFSRLLGENCDLSLTPPEKVLGIAKGIANRMMSNASVQAVLFERTERPVDQFDMLIIREERFQPETDSYERREERVIVDLHFTNFKRFMESEEDWLRELDILYAQDEALRRRIQRKIGGLQELED